MPTPLQESLQALLIIQRLDSGITRVKRAQAALDDGTSAVARATAACAEEQRGRDEWHRLAGELKDNELKLAAVETKSRSYQQKLYQGTVTNPKELANIEREIEALGRQRSDLDSRILELMDRTDQAKTALDVAQSHSAEMDNAQRAARDSYRAKYDDLTCELSDLMRQRADAAQTFSDKGLLKRYEDTRSKSGGIGLARIEEGSCGGCHMALPSFVIKAVRDGHELTACDNCSRLLTT
jgi:hypothetical protein